VLKREIIKISGSIEPLFDRGNQNLLLNGRELPIFILCSVCYIYTLPSTPTEDENSFHLFFVCTKCTK
jgi:hypothetical protein